MSVTAPQIGAFPANAPPSEQTDSQTSTTRIGRLAQYPGMHELQARPTSIDGTTLRPEIGGGEVWDAVPTFK